MINRYFNINFETDRSAVLDAIENRGDGFTGYIAVCDGNILSMVQSDLEYHNVIEGAMFAIMDSSWIPVYVKLKYGIRCGQYCGSDIFRDITERKKYRQYFLGSSQCVLDGLREQMSSVDSNISNMVFESLPFCPVEDFLYEDIASRINEDSPDVIWLSLGAPKQEQFAARLLPFLKQGIIIPVGAVFDFRSKVSVNRAPQWMIKCHLEFLYRLISEPKKQIRRCCSIISVLPKILLSGWKN